MNEPYAKSGRGSSNPGPGRVPMPMSSQHCSCSSRAYAYKGGAQGGGRRERGRREPATCRPDPVVAAHGPLGTDGQDRIARRPGHVPVPYVGTDGQGSRARVGREGTVGCTQGGEWYMDYGLRAIWPGVSPVVGTDGHAQGKRGRDGGRPGRCSTPLQLLLSFGAMRTKEERWGRGRSRERGRGESETCRPRPCCRNPWPFGHGRARPHRPSASQAMSSTWALPGKVGGDRGDGGVESGAWPAGD